MTTTSTPDEPRPNAALEKAILNLMFAGPTFMDVASTLLGDALKKLYPALDIDPNNTVVGDPDWDIVDGEIVARPTYHVALTTMLVVQAASHFKTLLMDGHHFLAPLPLVTPQIHLPVRIDQIGCLLNELAPALLTECQEQQIKYWNNPSPSFEPRWQTLSKLLRELWKLDPLDCWSTAECAMARHLYQYPDPQQRQAKDRFDTHAYLIDVDETGSDTTRHFNGLWMLVLTGTVAGKEVILAHSLHSGYQRFESRQALAQAVEERLHAITSCNDIQWRLYEPIVSIFDNLACEMIASQVNAFDELSLTAEIKKPPCALSGQRTGAAGQRAEADPGQLWFQQQIPEWLLAASTAEQNLFAQYLGNLSTLAAVHAGKTYLDEIPPISAFATNALKQAMLEEHPDAMHIEPARIEVEVRSPVAWGTYFIPGKFDYTRLDLVTLTLQNLVALPFGDKILRSLGDRPLPDWLTADYVETLIARIDLGRTYPALVKGKLLDDPTESARREELYTTQLRIQLPLLALESKLRGQGNIDERGCRYVAALMAAEPAQRKVDGQTIVLRRLAFVPQLQLGSAEDVVANMFVIGPKNPAAGPCLLYRPLLEPQLCQYPSPSNLLYAIRQDEVLRQSVLAWLPERVRATYDRYVFPGEVPSPWTVLEFVVTPLAAFIDSGPVELSRNELGSDFLSVLFRANAEAMIELADRQSVSNSEGRWKTFSQAGWLIFNLALPYLGTTAGTAVWLWQILEDVEAITQANGKSDAPSRQAAYYDLVKNMAMAIMTHAVSRASMAGRRGPNETPAPTFKPTPLPKSERVLQQLPPLAQGTLPPQHSPIHIAGALTHEPGNGARLLHAYAIDEPRVPGPPQAEGRYKGLYGQGEHSYARVAGEWFMVAVYNEQVFIVDANDTSRTGPPLISDAEGNWYLDTHLRLRGIGTQGIRQRFVEQAALRSAETIAELNRFETQKPQNLLLLTQDAEALDKASGAARDTARAIYLKTLATQRDNYERALKILTEWPTYLPVPDYPRTRIGYLNAQIDFTFAEIDLLRERFTPVMQKATQMIVSGVEALDQQHVDSAQGMVRLGDEMIERLEYMETRFDKLKRSGREGFEHVRRHRRKMPVYKSDDLRLIQLGMYRHLCLSLDSLGTLPEGWAQIDQLIDNATVSFQSLRDVLDERSEIRLDEQIEALASLTEQFSAIDEHLEYVASEYREGARPMQITRLRKQIGIFKARGLSRLAIALETRSNLRRVGGPYQPRPVPRKKFIRARFWGIVCGEPRLSKSGQETDLLDIRNPFSDEIIVTFHRKDSGEWVPRVKPETRPQIPPLAVSVAKGQALLDGLAAFKTQVQARLVQPDHTPTGVGVIINAHAARMEKISLAIRNMLQQHDGAANDTRVVPLDARRQMESLVTRLEDEAKALHEEGISAVSSAIKHSPPTMNGLIWLKNRNQVSITKIKTRQRQRAAEYPYFDRYEINDLNGGQTLWFADFYYSRSWVADHLYLYAQLKTPDPNSPVLSFDSTELANQFDQVNLYRSEIAVDQAKSVFFSKG